AQNRRVEIVDVTDDAAFQKYLATRRQHVEFYRAAAPSPAPVVATSTRDRPKTDRSPSFDDTLVMEGGAKPDAANSTDKSPRPAVPSKPTTPIPPTTPARGNRGPQVPAANAPASAVVAASNPSATSGAMDFGGVLASTVVAAADFGTELVPRPGLSLISTAYASGGPVAPNCSTDRPRVSNGVKSLRDQRDISITEYMPGLYNTSWMDTVNGNLVGLSNVAVLRDGGSPANRPNLFVYKAYKPG